MVKKKQKDNIEDIEEIIEMGPVNEKYKINKINLISLSVGIFSLILVVSLFLWINFYKNPKLLEESLIGYKKNFIAIIDNKENKMNDGLNQIDELIKNYQNQNQKLENFIKTYEEKEKNLNLTELYNKVEDIKIEIEALSEKLILIQNSHIEQTKKNNDRVDLSEMNRSNDNLEKKKLLLEQFKKIKNELFNKKSYGFEESKKQRDFKEIILNYLSGFFNLRDYRENENPRSLLAIAEKKANQGDLEGVIYNLQKLPDDWKKGLENFMENYKKYKVE